MSQLRPDGNPNKTLTRDSFDAEGNLASNEDALSLVVDSAYKAEAWIEGKQWGLLWRDADVLYQAPRPLSVFENTYVLEPNVQRFTVAKTVQALVPQFTKALFYDDPCFLALGRPGTSQDLIYAKTTVMNYFLGENFRRECKYGFEQMTHLGTCIFKWGVETKVIKVPKRKSSTVNLPTAQQQTVPILTDAAPVIEEEEKTVTTPTFEFRDLRDVLVDPKLKTPDIREADWVIDKRYLDFYQLLALKDDPNYDIPDDAIDLWFPPAESLAVAIPNTLARSTASPDVVHHGEDDLAETSGDPLRRKIECLEFWDRQRCIVVLNRRRVIKNIDNPFGKIPFLSANFWNRPRAFYGIGCGLIVGTNQRVDQGIINAALKMLSFGVQPTYLRSRDSNAPGQMIRTGLGKIIPVDGNVNDSFKLLDMPRIPPEIWAALKESEQATESSTGADQLLVQGTTVGPRSSMGRTAGGAGILAGASSSRLEGPFDNFTDQVFVPFLYILDELIYRTVPDSQIQYILGEELGKAFTISLDDYHNARMSYDLLAGSRMAAKRNMMQSLTLITQLFENPQIQANLADINEEYVDFKPLLKMWLVSSDWGLGELNDIIKKMTPEMKQKRDAANSQNAKLAQQQAMEQQKFEQKSELLDRENEGRIKRDIIRQSFRDASLDIATTGEPGNKGFGSE